MVVHHGFPQCTKLVGGLSITRPHPMASSSLPDVEGMVDEYLEQQCKIRRSYRDYQLLRVRDKATKREIEVVYRKMSMLLHPDRRAFATWAVDKYPNISQSVLDEGVKLIRATWDKYHEAKERLAELDAAKYKKAFLHTITHIDSCDRQCQTCFSCITSCKYTLARTTLVCLHMWNPCSGHHRCHAQACQG